MQRFVLQTVDGLVAEITSKHGVGTYASAYGVPAGWIGTMGCAAASCVQSGTFSTIWTRRAAPGCLTNLTSQLLQAAAAWRPVQHAWATSQHCHVRHFASEQNSKNAASGSDTGAVEADAAAAAAEQAAADEQAGSSELSELQELLKKAEDEVIIC
jgi:hypothetical protein